MRSNYRLPLKHFEKKSWKESELYNTNVRKLKIWPLLTIVSSLLIFTSFSFIVTQFKANSTQSITLTQGQNIDEIYIGKCLVRLINNTNWASQSCDKEYSFTLSQTLQKDFTKISSDPLYYLKFNIPNANLINTQLLITPVINEKNGHLNMSLLHYQDNEENLGLYGECRYASRCDLVRYHKDSKSIAFIKKNILEQFIKNPKLTSINLNLDNNKNYLNILSDLNTKIYINLKNNELEIL
jgi:hypothetical protein